MKRIHPLILEPEAGNTRSRGWAKVAVEPKTGSRGKEGAYTCEGPWSRSTIPNGKCAHARCPFPVRLLQLNIGR